MKAKAKVDRRRCWSPEEDAQALAMFNAGQTSAQIGRALGRSTQAVRRRRILLSSGLTDYYQKKVWTPAEDAQLIRLLAADERPAAISAALGRTPSSIHTRTGVLRERHQDLLPIRGSAAWTERLPAASSDLITAEDIAWMQYWRQPRAVRRAQREAP